MLTWEDIEKELDAEKAEETAIEPPSGLGGKRESLKKILRENWESQTTDLHLSKLTFIPSALRHFTHVETLLVTDSQQLEDTATIGKMSQLKSLIVANSNINDENIKPISKLTDLEHLSLANGKIKNLPDDIGNLKRLRSLWMPSNQLRTVPKSIGQLTKLERLGLAHNQLGADPQYPALPGSVKHLPRCTIELTGNPIPEKELLRITDELESHRHEHDGGPTINCYAEQSVKARINGRLSLPDSVALWLSPPVSVEGPLQRIDLIKRDQPWSSIEQQFRDHHIKAANGSSEHAAQLQDAERNIGGFSEYLERSFREVKDDKGNIPEQFEKEMVDFLRTIEKEPALAYAIIPATITALGDCNSPLILVFEQIKMVVEDYFAKKENWSAEKRLTTGHQRFIKNQIGPFIEKHMARYAEESADLGTGLLLVACKQWDMPGPTFIPENADKYEIPPKYKTAFYQFVREQELSTDLGKNKFPVEIEYNNYVHDTFRAQPHSNETKQLIARLDTVMDRIKVLKTGQGQKLIKSMMDYRTWDSKLEERLSPQMESIDKDFESLIERLGTSHEEWQRNQHFDSKMSGPKQTQASSQDTFKVVGHLIRILNEATTFALQMEGTLLAVKEHCLPDLEIATHKYFMSSSFKERTFAQRATHNLKKTVGISVKPSVLFSPDADSIGKPAKPIEPSNDLLQKLSKIGITMADAEFHWAPAENFRIPESCVFHEMDDGSFLFHDKGRNRIMRVPQDRIGSAGRVQTLRSALQTMANGETSNVEAPILHGKHDTFTVPAKNSLRKGKANVVSQGEVKTSLGR